MSQDRLASSLGLVGLGLTILTLAGLGALVARALPTSRVLDQALRQDPRLAAWMRSRPSPAQLPSGRPLARVVFVPFLRRRHDVERVRNLAYGPAGRSHRLDVYRHRSCPAGAPVLVHFHGGRFVSGAKNPSRCLCCTRSPPPAGSRSAPTYRLGRAGAIPNAHTDAKRVLAWVRANVHRFGGDPDSVIVAATPPVRTWRSSPP